MSIVWMVDGMLLPLREIVRRELPEAVAGMLADVGAEAVRAVAAGDPHARIRLPREVRISFRRREEAAVIVESLKLAGLVARTRVAMEEAEEEDSYPSLTRSKL